MSKCWSKFNRPCAGDNEVVFVDKLTHIANSSKSDRPPTITTYSLTSSMVNTVLPITIVQSTISMCLMTALWQHKTLDSILTG